MAPARLNEVDRLFLKTVAEYNLSQIEMGNMTDAVAENESLKDFGNTIALTHAKKQRELSKLASLVQYQLPGVPGAQHEATKKGLLKSKEHFDSLYIHAQRERFANIKEVLVQQQQSGLQQDIKNYAAGLLTEVNEYIRIADSFAGRY